MNPFEPLVRIARKAVPSLAKASAKTRDAALMGMALGLREARPRLLRANAADVEAARASGASEAFVDRLRLDASRIEGMAQALEEVAGFTSPLGRIEAMTVRPNGMRVGRMRIPLGVIAFIYEARPNVTSDAAGLCIKSGNAVILKGGSDAQHSNEVIVDVLGWALQGVGLPPGSIQLITLSDREELAKLLELDEFIDLVIPRGGESLIRFVSNHSRIPVLKHYKGVCHIYLDESAEEAMAVEICENAKVQRPSVCNAMETLLVNREAAHRLLPAVARRLVEHGVALHGCEATRAILQSERIAVIPAAEEDYFAEYLSLDLAVRVVSNMEEAIDHIRQYGSSHTEAIVTSDYRRAMDFVRQVDSSVVLVNASTRFSDGGQLGLGAEIGISTSKLHAFGPMGLEELTARKFVVLGDGQTRAS